MFFEHVDRVSSPGEGNCRGHAGSTGADDADMQARGG
jgi:hypothetical protein